MRAKIIAYYLPQFHPIPENDEWWGPGFTEWTNVARARPLFRGHQQPNLPGELGFYDLRLPETRQAQAELAREHGIHGFLYWHYWFGQGRRILERPFREVLESGEPDFPFCLGWANATWTGKTYGTDRVLIEQQYPGEADHEAHFRLLEPALHDRRYIRVHEKPLVYLFHPWEIPQVERFIDQWQALAVQSGLPGLHVVGEVRAANEPVWCTGKHSLDASVIDSRSRVFFGGHELNRRIARRTLHPDRVDYRRGFLQFPQLQPNCALSYPCIAANWDNTPRAGRRGTVLVNSDPVLFELQVQRALELVETRPTEERFVFLKSWNEWAEGNYVEPDRVHGRGFLEAVRRAQAGR